MENNSETNKALTLEAFDFLFNKRDFASAEKFWSPDYIQHSAHIGPGREGLFELVRSLPLTMKYDNQLTIASGNYVMLHGRYSGLPNGSANWVVVDIVRLENGVFVEHWDVIQDEATKAQSKSGAPMFGNEFPSV